MLFNVRAAATRSLCASLQSLKAAAVQISGSQEAPVKDITIRGLEIRDTAYTYLGTDTADLHGMPSGGDCARHPHIVSSVCRL